MPVTGTTSSGSNFPNELLGGSNLVNIADQKNAALCTLSTPGRPSGRHRAEKLKKVASPLATSQRRIASFAESTEGFCAKSVETRQAWT
jgi:hypothetical protein